MSVTQVGVPDHVAGVPTRAMKFRLYPTSKQHTALGSMLGAHAEVYNAALQERRDAYRSHGVSIKATQQMAQLTEMRLARPDQAVWSFTSQQQTLRRLDKAFAAFFRRAKAGQTPGFPRFRSAARFDSVDFRHGDGLRIEDLARPAKKNAKREAKVYVQGVGHVRMWLHRDLPVLLDAKGRVAKGQFGQVTIKREGGTRRPKWFVVITVDSPVIPVAPTGAVAGLDLATGENGLAYTSDGARIENPQHLKKAADRLAAAQVDLARKKRGSSNRRKAVERVARLHAKVSRSRLDYLHKQAAALIATYDLIAVEDLAITNMTRRAAPRPDPENPGTWLPNGGTAKTGLNKSILDAGWGIFVALLHAKAESAGRVVVNVDPRNTSRTCHACGHLDPAARNGKRYTCTNPDCTQHGITQDADINAALNILRAGLAQYAQTQAA